MRVRFDIEDLFTIREMAQEYMKTQKVKNPYNAVEGSRAAYKKLKEYFNDKGRYRAETSRIKGKVESRAGQSQDYRIAGKSAKNGAIQVGKETGSVRTSKRNF